jgi:hypothetical protein
MLRFLYLRARIREFVDAEKGIYRPDFELKVSNHWKGSGVSEPCPGSAPNLSTSGGFD